MTRPPIDGPGLVEALRVEAAGYRALLKVLEAEMDALRRADAEAVLALTSTKLEHVSALQSLAGDRADRLNFAGCPDMDTGLAAWLVGSPHAEEIRAHWTTLRDLAFKAQRANDLNGRLIARQRQHFEAAQAALLSAAGAAPVYGADGLPQGTGERRTLLAV
jgi:flagella synthesis protein FlgN